MKVSAKRRFDRIDQKLEELLEELAAYDHEQLNQPPPDDGWTAMQVMHHLLLAENYAYLYLKKKLSFNPKLKPAGFGTAYRRFLLRFYLGTPLKFKAPKGVDSDALPAQSNLKEVGELWQSNRRQLREYMESFPDTHYGKALYKHPVAGKLTLDGMLAFFEHHFDRHHKQIRRTLSSN